MKGKYKEPTKIKIWYKPILMGSVLGLAIILFMFIALSLLLSFGLIPLSSAPTVASLSISVGAFFGGRSSAKKLGQNGLIVGALSSFVLFLVFTLIGMAAFTSAPGINTLVRMIIFLVAGAIGGIVGVGNANKRKIV